MGTAESPTDLVEVTVQKKPGDHMAGTMCMMAAMEIINDVGIENPNVMRLINTQADVIIITARRDMAEILRAGMPAKGFPLAPKQSSQKTT
jgi:hypothetical protein